MMFSRQLLVILSTACAGIPIVSAQQYTLRDIYNAGNWLNMFQFQAVRIFNTCHMFESSSLCRSTTLQEVL